MRSGIDETITAFLLSRRASDPHGWRDFGVYGGTTATPRIDKFANEVIHFNNYNVELRYTPTRSGSYQFNPFWPDIGDR
jgi:hypothetical protein